MIELVGEPGSGKTHLLAELAAEANRRGLRILNGLCAESPQTARSFLDRCAEAGTRVVLIDDAHRAEDGVLDLVEFLVHRPWPAPMLVVIAHRPRQASSRLRSALAQGVERSVAGTIELGPLSLSESAQLLGSDPGDDWVREVHDRASGVPLYLLLLARMHGPDRSQGTVPEHVVALALSELASLPQPDLTVAWSVALLGEHADLDAVMAVADLSPADVTHAVSRLMRAELLRPTGTGGWLGLRHPVLAELLYGAIESSWRAAAHRRALAVLVARRAPARDQAEHIERSLTFPDEEEVALLVRGATQQMWSDPVVAARWLRRALQAMPDEEPWHAVRVKTTVLLGQALVCSGELVAARDKFHEILDHATVMPAELRCTAVAACSSASLMLGNHAEARALLVTNLANLTPDTPGRLRIAVALAFVDVLSGCPGADQRVDQAIELAQGQGADVELAGLSALRVISGLGTADVAVAARTLAESAATFDALDDLSATRSIEYLAVIGWAESALGRFAAADRHLTRGLRIARKAGHVHVLPVFLAALSQLNRHVGSVTRAWRMAEEAGKTAERIGSQQLYAIATAEQSLSAVWALPGDAGEPLKLAKTAAAVAWSTPSWCPGGIGSALARAMWFGRSATRWSLTRLIEMTGGKEPLADSRFGRISSFEMFAAMYADMNDPRAGQWADRADRAQSGLPTQRGYVIGARAHAARAADDHVRAAALYQEAAGAFRALGIGCEEARMLVLAAGCLARNGTVAEATALLDTAKETARRHDAHWLIDRAEEWEEQLSGSPADAGTLAVLTDREREIALHAGSGKRTRRIADELVLSPRTVDLHLGRIYRKLNVSSRAALVRLIAEMELNLP
ncbi:MULTISPECIES: LuxR C-terminal-related transcriptional regulator [unclassified Streptomyces]|uniref:LuxR C-terminal-related transcriptional regulator n=1 Tax=unclassified Streptomyces TaxID=2593676 RepID=UPI00324A4284